MGKPPFQLKRLRYADLFLVFVTYTVAPFPLKFALLSVGGLAVKVMLNSFETRLCENRILYCEIKEGLLFEHLLKIGNCGVDF